MAFIPIASGHLAMARNNVRRRSDLPARHYLEELALDALCAGFPGVENPDEQRVYGERNKQPKSPTPLFYIDR